MLWQIIGHRSALFPLLYACRLVEFDTSVICRVFIREFAFEGLNMKFTVNMLLTCILYILMQGQAVIRTVCKYSR